MAIFYVDNNETIYAIESVRSTSVAVGDSNKVTMSLSNLTELSGQSTWLINRVHFFTKIFSPEIDPPNNLESYCGVLGGVAPDGYSGDLDSVNDYQEIKGWPLKGVQKYLFVRADAVGSRTNSPSAMSSFSKTWSPSRRNHLALNRSQDLVLNTKVISMDGGGGMGIFSSIIVEGRRGD